MWHELNRFVIIMSVHCIRTVKTHTQIPYSSNAGNLACLGSWMSTRKYSAPAIPVEEEEESYAFPPHTLKYVVRKTVTLILYKHTHKHEPYSWDSHEQVHSKEVMTSCQYMNCVLTSEVLYLSKCKTAPFYNLVLSGKYLKRMRLNFVHNYKVNSPPPRR